jgi:hypothetical protein
MPGDGPSPAGAAGGKGVAGAGGGAVAACGAACWGCCCAGQGVLDRQWLPERRHTAAMLPVRT